MKYLIVDACFGGTGIRDKYEGGYLFPTDLRLSHTLVNKINEWIIKYENEHFNTYKNTNIINDLDKDGIEIALEIKAELLDIKIEYFSAAKMITEII